MSKGKQTPMHTRLHEMEGADINQAACTLLEQLMQCASINLIAQLTRITRTTLYRWLDADVELERMSPQIAGWFILICETSPKLQALLQRGARSHPRLAKRITDEVK